MSRLSRTELAHLSAAIAVSTAAQLERIVAMLDALPDRGEADRVLDAARGRLRALRPVRPLNLTRLIFLPLDGAIVAPGSWRPEDGRVPRNALTPLAGAVAAGLGARCREVTAQLSGLSLDDQPAVIGLGAQIWEDGAAVLALLAGTGRVPPGWTEAGLRPEQFQPLAALCAAVLAHGVAIQRAVAAGRDGPPEALARQALRLVAPAGREAFGAVLATLLRTASRPGALSALATAISPAAGRMADSALEAALEARLPDIPSLSPQALPASIENLRDLLDDAASATAGRGPDWRKRLEGWRHGADLACRAAYAAHGREQVLAPAERLARGAVSDGEAALLEEQALALRRFELAARTLGGEGAYDASRRALLDRLRQLAREGGPATRVEMSRLAEILGGAEAGMALLAD
ncbi:hypothetical protein [Roseomonas sp. BN140053]|uniref:hypothetical protein n=1 Tax=Roseomonas sp. BN140053 TaxID=3391898 RepID=UPI0039E9EEB8